MRKIAFTLIAAVGIGLSGAASAADLGTAPIYRKAPPAPVFTWTGGYIGGFVGGAASQSDSVTTVAGTTSAYGLGSSFIGGITSGYNLQVSPNWLIGYDSETGYIGLKGSSALGAGVVNTETNAIYDVWAARVGYIADRSLFYVKGGGALARFNTSYSDPATYISGHKFVFGYAVGGGWEYAIDPKWSVKAEYLYLGFDKTFDFGPVPGLATTSVSGVHTGKVGLNYKFDALGFLLGGLR